MELGTVLDVGAMSIPDRGPTWGCQCPCHSTCSSEGHLLLSLSTSLSGRNIFLPAMTFDKDVKQFQAKILGELVVRAEVGLRF